MHPLSKAHRAVIYDPLFCPWENAIPNLQNVTLLSVNGEEVDSMNTERINSVMAPTEDGEALYVLRALGAGF